MESNIGEVDISILRQLYTTLEEERARLVEQLAIERAKVVRLEAELSTYSENGTEDGQQMVVQNADPNPLLQERVLQQVSDYMDHKTKASGRLVCQKWKDIITPEFRETSKLTLDFSSYIDKEIDNMALKLSIAFPQSENEELIRIPPCVDLTFKPSKRHRGTRMLLKRLSSFGKYIKELTLRMTRTINRTDRVAQDLFLEILNSCNNLEALIIPCPAIEPLSSNVQFPQINSLQIGEEREEDTEAYLIPVINSILKSTPNLTTLRLSTFKTEGDILSCFATCRDAGYLESLSELVLWCSFVTPESLSTLSQCQFKCLKTLNLEAKDLDVNEILDFQDAAALTTLLSNLSTCLESLKIGMKILNEEEEVFVTISSLPRMECLKSFSFTDEMTTEQGSIDELMNKFPNLKILSLGYSWENDFIADQLFPENLPVGSQYFTLTKLWIPNLAMKSYETREDYSPFEIVARCFPQLQSFGVGFNFEGDQQENFKIAISDLSYMSQLSELSIAFKGVSESDFNDSVSEMFEDKFQGLKILSFLNVDDEYKKISLDKEMVKKAFENAPSYTDLTFRYFSIKANEKQEIFRILSKLKRVCFRECSFVDVPIDQDFARASALPGEEFGNFEIGVSTGLDLGY